MKAALERTSTRAALTGGGIERNVFFLSALLANVKNGTSSTPQQARHVPLIPILSFSWPPVDLEGACGSAMAAVMIFEQREEEKGMGFAAAAVIVDKEILRAAGAADVARRGPANAEARGDCTFERIAVVARAVRGVVIEYERGERGEQDEFDGGHSFFFVPAASRAPTNNPGQCAARPVPTPSATPRPTRKAHLRGPK